MKTKKVLKNLGKGALVAVVGYGVYRAVDTMKVIADAQAGTDVKAWGAKAAPLLSAGAVGGILALILWGVGGKKESATT